MEEGGILESQVRKKQGLCITWRDRMTFFLGGGPSGRPQIACWIHQEQRRSKNNHPE